MTSVCCKVVVFQILFAANAYSHNLSATAAAGGALEEGAFEAGAFNCVFDCAHAAVSCTDVALVLWLAQVGVLL